MPRPRKPARLYARPDTEEWVIRDGGKTIRTGHRGPSGRTAAEEALARHLASRLTVPDTPQQPEALLVEVVVAAYLGALADADDDDIRAAPERQAYAWAGMAPYWRGKFCSEVDEKSSRTYTKWRAEGEEGRRPASRATARRELGMLRAALNSAHRSGLLTQVPVIDLPAKGERRPEYLTRDELARLLWELWRGPRYVTKTGKLSKPSKRTQHAARLVLAGAYGGSRPTTTARTTWTRRDDGPWVDLEANVWYRAGEGERQTVKARRAFRMSRSLLAHLRRWRRLHGGTYIVEHPRHPGEPILDIGNAIASAAKRAGIEKRVTPHTLKHTAITLYIQSGGAIADAAEIYSTSVQTIQSVYWHHSPEHQSRAAEVAGRLGKAPEAAQKRTETPRSGGK